MNSNTRGVSWSYFKSLIDAGAMQWQWSEGTLPDNSFGLYILYGNYGSIALEAQIVKNSSAEHLDFENNYKNSYFLRVNPVPDVGGSAVLDALNEEIVLAVNGQSSVSFEIVGTLTGTLSLTASVDQGLTWIAVPAFQLNPGATVNSIAGPFPNILVLGAGGFSHVRLRMTAFTSGSVAVSWRYSIGTNMYHVFSGAAQAFKAWAELHDGSGNAITSTVNGAKRQLDVTPAMLIDRSGSGTITTLNGTVTANTQGCASIIFNVLGTWVATIGVEGTVDGTNWFSVIGLDQSQAVFASFSGTNTRVYVNCAGFSQIRLNATAFTSGTVNVAWNANGSAPAVFQVWNTNAASLKVQARLQDSLANNITTQANGSQRAMDVGVNVAGVQVDPRSIRALTASDVVTVSQPTASALNAQVVGEIASDAADSGNPIKIGYKAESGFPAAVADSDRVDGNADLFGRARVVVHPDDKQRLGVYYYSTGTLLVQAAADGALVGRCWLINPVGSAVTVRIRKIIFTCQVGSTMVTATSPRIIVQRVTFTGTASGATVAPALRRSTDAANVGSLRTASTGMTLTAGATVHEFLPVASQTAIGCTAAGRQEMDAFLEDYIELAAGQGLVIRQPDAGTTADTRRFVISIIAEEF